MCQLLFAFFQILMNALQTLVLMGQHAQTD